MSFPSGTLWIVATPLGNPGDLSPRAREIIGGVDGVLAEDTRKAGLLLSRCGLSAASFSSFHDHNEEAKLGRTIARLKGGENLALLSDAGTPLLSDPGYRLVRACRKAGITVSPVPGPSAPVAALSACGLPPYPYVFLGFAPRKSAERETFFAPFAELSATLVFFERKDRLAETLHSAHMLLGKREACIARELTKPHEEFLLFRLEEHRSLPDTLLGELTVILGPPDGPVRTRVDLVDTILAEEAAAGGKTRDAAKRAQLRIAGWTGKELYQRLQSLRPGNGA
jgi:16S rRNA (cytidine1402-2'-O)-methyltransferase